MRINDALELAQEINAKLNVAWDANEIEYIEAYHATHTRYNDGRIARFEHWLNTVYAKNVSYQTASYKEYVDYCKKEYAKKYNAINPPGRPPLPVFSFESRYCGYLSAKSNSIILSAGIKCRPDCLTCKRDKED